MLDPAVNVSTPLNATPWLPLKVPARAFMSVICQTSPAWLPISSSVPDPPVNVTLRVEAQQDASNRRRHCRG
ncbi:MAG: hypothetical protein U0736_11710 [Gemmataceae bacterium]